MKKRTEILALGILSLLLQVPCSLSAQHTESFYEEDTTSLILNPERGWFRRDYGSSPEVVPDYGSLPNVPVQAVFSSLRSEGITVFKHHWKIPRSAGLTQAFLDTLRKECEIVRKNGFKLIWRFSYNINVQTEPQDAPLSRIQRHLDQMKPVFHENKDVIALIEPGFVGYWGEWHHSYYNHVCQGGTRLTESGRAVINKVLEVLPIERMTGLRYPKTKMFSIVNNCKGSDGGMGFPSPLTEENAYNETDQSRLGYWNQSWGTDIFGPYNENDEQTGYVKEDTRFVPQWGEPAADSDEAWSPRDAFADAKLFHFSLINAYQGDTKSLMKEWKSDGTYLKFAKYLGYRFRLISATCEKTINPGDPFKVKLVMRNDGFASPFNPRLVKVVLRMKGSDKVYVARANPEGSETRLWLPGPDQEKTLVCEAAIPPSMASGNWEVLLWLPDPEPSLMNRPEYAIHLANTNVWEPETGYNRLGIMVKVSDKQVNDAGSGLNEFEPVNK